MASMFQPRSWMFVVACAGALFLACSYPTKSMGDEIRIVPQSNVPDLREPEKLRLVSGQAVVLQSERELKRVSEPDKEVASALLLSPHEVYLTPRAAGTTNLILWHNEMDVAAVYELQVVYDLSRLKQRLHEIFPDERELRVMSTNDSITLAGRVSSSSNMDQILTLTEAFAPRDKIRNLVQVGGVHQVMLEVTVAEMSRTVGRELGIDFGWIRGDEFAVSTFGDLSTFEIPQGEFTGFSDVVKALFRFEHGSVTWSAFINALQREGFAKVLAEPSLVSLSGQTASFLAGGEFPIPEVDREGNVGVMFRNFGIELAFTPTVLDKDRIAIKVVPVVSELDRARGTTIAGAFVPALRTRRASTTVELGDGQSFAIAGLLSETTEETLSKFPGLGDLPVLGSLFSSKSYQSNETELVILVTPRLVKPVVAAQHTLPTDFYIKPTDAEFYLGELFGRSRDYGSGNPGFDGEFGHVIVR